MRFPITDDNRRWWVLGAMCCALFMAMLDNTVVNVALPSIQRDLGMSIAGLEWTINAYTLALAVLLVFIGSKVFVAELFGWTKFPAEWSLAVTFAILGAGIGWSLWKTRDEDAAAEGQKLMSH